MQSKLNGQVLIRQDLIFILTGLTSTKKRQQKKKKGLNGNERKNFLTCFKAEGNFLLKLIIREKIKITPVSGTEKILEKTLTT